MARPRFEDNLPSKSAIFDFWKDRIVGVVRSIDWGEPGCWACGFHCGAKYDIKRSDASWGEIFRCWNDVPLQRCHIVARSLRGTNEVSNLFLMCLECHDRMPNSDIPEIFFEWARAQSWSARESAKFLDAMKAFGIEEAVWPDLDHVITSESFKVWSNGKSGLHWPQSNYASISSRLTPATTVGLAVHYFRTFGACQHPEQTRSQKSC